MACWGAVPILAAMAGFAAILAAVFGLLTCIGLLVVFRMLYDLESTVLERESGVHARLGTLLSIQKRTLTIIVDRIRAKP